MGAFKLTIRDVLESSCFKNSIVIAGHDGLDKIFRWVHVMEVSDIRKPLNGNELILATGVKETSLLFLKQLIDAGVSGLCVELVKYRNEIPEEMINLANKNQFPIIVFHEEVRFIDITQMINTNLINNQYKILLDLEEFSLKLNQTLLLPNAFKRVLNLLYDHLNVQLLYLSKNKDDVIFVPLQNEREQERLLLLVEKYKGKRISTQNKQFQVSNGYYAGQSIQILGHTFAELLIFPQNQPVSDYDLLVLDRCAIAISQDLLRIFYIEERKKFKEKQWIQDWLKGEHTEKELDLYLSSLDQAIKPKGAAVCVCEMEGKIDESTYSYYKSIFRNIFQNHGLFLFSVIENNNLIFILINLREDNWKFRVSKALDQICRTDLFKRSTNDKPQFGVGKYTVPLQNLTESYLTAKESLLIQNKVSLPHDIFYENLHIYRLISILNKQGNLREYMLEYIGPVIEHDQKHNSDLLNTLSVFFESNGSKKDAAKNLFIVRQTLYHRLDKLKELLGPDFMEPFKRIAIEVAVYAYKYLRSSEAAGDSNIKAI